MHLGKLKNYIQPTKMWLAKMNSARLMWSIMKTRNNRMYQLDQVTLKKKEKEREREREENLDIGVL